MLSDRFIGSVLLALSTAFVTYCMLWIGFMPFVDRNHFTQAFFPPREYGLLLAALVMTTGLGLSITLASIHTILRTGYHQDADAAVAAAAASASLTRKDVTTQVQAPRVLNTSGSGTSGPQQRQRVEQTPHDNREVGTHRHNLDDAEEEEEGDRVPSQGVRCAQRWA